MECLMDNWSMLARYSWVDLTGVLEIVHRMFGSCWRIEEDIDIYLSSFFHLDEHIEHDLGTIHSKSREHYLLVFAEIMFEIFLKITES